MGRRAHALAHHPNRSRQGGRSLQTLWRGNRGTVPRTERRRSQRWGKGRRRRWERTAPTRARGPPPMGSRGRGGAPAGIPAATLLHSASAPSTGRRSSGRGRAAPQIDTHRHSGHGHSRPRAACSAGTSMGHVAGPPASPLLAPDPPPRPPSRCRCRPQLLAPNPPPAEGVEEGFGRRRREQRRDWGRREREWRGRRKEKSMTRGAHNW
jgi:hypothetical protein